MCFQTCTLHVWHCHTDEDRWITGLFFIEVGNWNWIIFDLQHIGWLNFNCFHWHLMWRCTDIHRKRNGKKSNLSLWCFKSQDRDSNVVLVDTIIDEYLSGLEGLEMPKVAKWVKLELISWVSQRRSLFTKVVIWSYIWLINYPFPFSCKFSLFVWEVKSVRKAKSVNQSGWRSSSMPKPVFFCFKKVTISFRKS